MKIQLITPSSADLINGNHITALRLEHIFTKLGNQVITTKEYKGEPVDLMVALHALRSFTSIKSFHELHPKRPLIVMLTGTDLYQHVKFSEEACQSLHWATRLVVLQKQGLNELSKDLRNKTKVIYQSVTKKFNFNEKLNFFTKENFNVLVVANFRPEKDPLRTSLASSLLPKESKIQVFHIGIPLNPEYKERIKIAEKENPRYHYLGSFTYEKTQQAIALADLVCISSRLEGGSNVLCEALAIGTPVLTTNIPSLVATLGENYPGYFSVADTETLKNLLLKAELDSNFYQELKNGCAKVTYLVEPEREEKSWDDLLKELSEC
jgi:putative glycosyltransferase (TIGR04348 family)